MRSRLVRLTDLTSQPTRRRSGSLCIRIAAHVRLYRAKIHITTVQVPVPEVWCWRALCVCLGGTRVSEWGAPKC